MKLLPKNVSKVLKEISGLTLGRMDKVYYSKGTPNRIFYEQTELDWAVDNGFIEKTLNRNIWAFEYKLKEGLNYE